MFAIGPSFGWSTPSRLKIGTLELDTLHRRAEVSNRILDLSEKAYMALELLVLHRGRTLNSGAILDYLFPEEAQDPRIVPVIMFKIRRALTQAGAPDFIATVWGEGYRVEVPRDYGVEAARLCPAFDLAIVSALGNPEDVAQPSSACAGPPCIRTMVRGRH